VISFVIEIPAHCVQNGLSTPGDVLGAWASVRKLEHRATDSKSSETKHFAGEQTTRLGNPLVNELLIGTTYKNEWNARHPSGDVRFNEFILNPVVPAYISELFPITTAPAFQRVDLLAILHTGIPSLNLPLNQAKLAANIDHRHHENSAPAGGVVLSGSDSDRSRHSHRKRDSHHDHDDHHRGDDDDDSHRHGEGSDAHTAAPAAVVYADILRLNITAGTWVSCAAQKALGVIAGDAAGYPNGRRLGDDVVDITLRAAMGVLCQNAAFAATYCGGAANVAAASSKFRYTDQAAVRACMFKCSSNDFPFLNPPIPGNYLWQPAGSSLYTVSQFVAGCAVGGVVPTNTANLDALLALFVQ